MLWILGAGSCELISWKDKSYSSILHSRGSWVLWLESLGSVTLREKLTREQFRKDRPKEDRMDTGGNEKNRLALSLRVGFPKPRKSRECVWESEGYQGGSGELHSITWSTGRDPGRILTYKPRSRVWHTWRTRCQLEHVGADRRILILVTTVDWRIGLSSISEGTCNCWGPCMVQERRKRAPIKRDIRFFPNHS